jgi:hypothetical protein
LRFKNKFLFTNKNTTFLVCCFITISIGLPFPTESFSDLLLVILVMFAGVGASDFIFFGTYCYALPFVQHMTSRNIISWHLSPLFTAGVEDAGQSTAG